MATEYRIQLRRGTAVQWTTANPILISGEAGFETDTGKIKFGNGADDWAMLPYFTAEAADHNHDLVYSAISHNHDLVYAIIAHNHDVDYAAAVHNHNLVYAGIIHNHNADYPAINDARLSDERTPTDNSVSQTKLSAAFKTKIAMALLDIDWSSGITFTKTITANETFTFSNLHVGTKFLEIEGDFAITLPSEFVYAGGEKSSVGTTLIQIVCTDAVTPKGWFILLKDES